MLNKQIKILPKMQTEEMSKALKEALKKERERLWDKLCRSYSNPKGFIISKVELRPYFELD